MHVLAVIGSPNGMNGNTGLLLNAFLEGVRQAGAEPNVCSLAELQVQPCRACGSCHRKGLCPIEDAFGAIAGSAAAAEAIVLASPNYMFNVSAQMKAFLDRCCGPLHCRAWDGKYGAAVVSSGGGGAEEVQACLLRFLRAMGCWTVGSVGAESRQLSDGRAAATVMQAAHEAGRPLVEAVRGRSTFQDQIEERRAFADRMRHLVMAMKDVWPYEYEYWHSHGRL